MRAAFDEVLATGLKRQHPVQDIVGDLLKAEIAEKQARSIKYQLTTARLALAKGLADPPSPGAGGSSTSSPRDGRAGRPGRLADQLVDRDFVIPSSAICPSLNPADSFCSISSPSSTNGPP